MITTKLKEKNQDLDAASETTLKSQILGLAKKESPVRLLMWKRLLAYVRLVKTSKALPPVPPGFGEISEDLQSLATAFKRITVYNYSVFGEHYDKILEGAPKVPAESEAGPSAAGLSAAGTSKENEPAVANSDSKTVEAPKTEQP